MKRERGSTDEIDFVEQVIVCLGNRSKAIKHQGGTLEWQRIDEIEQKSPSESSHVEVEISHQVTARPVLIRLKVWPDRWVWIDARRSTKHGWAWFTTLEGRFLAKEAARALVRIIEETVSATKNTDDTVPTLIKNLWASSLAKGPRGL